MQDFDGFRDIYTGDGLLPFFIVGMDQDGRIAEQKLRQKVPLRRRRKDGLHLVRDSRQRIDVRSGNCRLALPVIGGNIY